MIKVLIVDDHDLVRYGIKRILEEPKDMDTVGECKSGEEAIIAARKLNPDIILMDVKMSGIGGLEAIARITNYNPKIKIIAVTSLGGEPYPSKILNAGAKGYLTKKSSAQEIIKAIRTVSIGKKYITPDIAQQLALKHLDETNKSALDSISEREMQVLIMITSGKKVNEISETLCLSPKTVNSYRYRLFEKLDINSDVELTHFALRHKLIEPR